MHNNIKELENFFDSTHGDLFDYQIWPTSNPHSIIPTITQNSIFVENYNEEIYDTMLDELRNQYE